MGAIIGGGVALVGGLMGANAAKSAANTQAAAIQQGIDFQKQVYGTAQTNLQPFVGAGTSALGSLAQLYGLPAVPGSGVAPGSALTAYNNFTKTPFYQFPLSQGVQALNASGAAQGLSLSGGQAKALQAYGQGYASQNFNSYISALSGLANLGGNSASSLAGVGNNAAQTTLAGQTSLGTAQASGITGANNALQKALGAIPLILGGGNQGTGSTYGSSVLNGVGNLWTGVSNALSGAANGYSPLPIAQNPNMGPWASTIAPAGGVT